MDQEQEKDTKIAEDVVPIEEIVADDPFKTIDTPETAVQEKPVTNPTSGEAPKPSEILKSGFSQTQAPKATEISKPSAGFVGKRATIKRPRNKIASVFAVIFVLLVASCAAFFFFFYRVKVTINTNPAPDKVVLDGKEVKPGTFTLMPGKHSIEIIKDGFVSFKDERAFKVNENINLDFKFEPAKEPTLVSQGGYFPAITRDGNFLIFIASSGQIFSQKISEKDQAPIPLSNGTFQSVNQLLISNNGQFALVKDAEALKVVDFNRADVINQKIAILPPAISQVSSITWNGIKSDYFPEENSRLVYDLKTDSGWRLYLTDRTHSQTDILATLDPKNFTSLWLDWNENNRQVLLAGGEAGLIDLSSREYTTISNEAKFLYCKWGPEGKYAALVDELGNLYKLEEGKLTKTNYKTKPELLSFTATNKLVIASQSRPIEVNFDTLTSIDYAEIKGLEKAQRVSVAQGMIFYQDPAGIYQAPLAFSSYEQK